MSLLKRHVTKMWLEYWIFRIIANRVKITLDKASVVVMATLALSNLLRDLKQSLATP